MKKLLMFMRHGEKLIKTGQKPKCGRFDSELSPLGIDQAFLSGQRFIEQLKKYFPDISPSDISIISSPYMRTLQATSHFLRGISAQNFFRENIDNIYNISIENGVREILNKDKLKGEDVPKDFLNFLNNPNYKDFDEEIKKLKLNVLKNYEFSAEKESRDECFIRCKKYVDEYLVNYDKKNEYKVIVIISHAGPIQFMMRTLGFNVENVQNILFCEQYYFDISEGVKNAKFLEKINFK